MKYQSHNYPSLTKSYKNFFPFKIGTTSFIYPDSYVPNVKMLGAFVDEIELLLFESAPVINLLTGGVLTELNRLARDLQVTYNIHLPTDISITDSLPTGQARAAATLVAIIERMEVLSPSSYTLHVPGPDDVNSAKQVAKWSDVAYRNLARMAGLGIPADRIAIESIDYPFNLIGDVIDELNYKICMDVGHLMLNGHNINEFFKQYGKKISVIHLHGVQHHRDHLSLAELPAARLNSFLNLLQRFKGTVSIEVFSFEKLTSSLNYLAKCWQSMQFETDS